ncbi:MAG: 2'-5' RNA ligase family protein [Novosphingobium sp.]
MAFGINIRAYGDAAPYWDLVNRVSALESVPSMRSLGYPPHLTLAKYDALDDAHLRTGLDALGEFPKLTLTFDRMGRFGPGPLILWVAPRPDAALDEMYARVHAAIDPSRCRPAYRPGAWVPHCSIALQVDENNRDLAHRMAQEPITPFSLTFDVADCVSSPPVSIIAERLLR